MAAPIKNIWCEDRRSPFQVNQLPGKDFQSLSAKNYNYLERWIFPHDLCSYLKPEGEAFSITRIFRYSNTDKYSVETLNEIDPRISPNDNDIVYTAKILTASEKFFTTLAANAFKKCSTHIQLDPLQITLQVGTEEVTLSLNQV